MKHSLAFCTDTSNPFYEAVLAGVRQGVAAEEDAHLLSWMGSERFPYAALKYLEPEALIVGPISREKFEALPAGRPIVGFSNAREQPYAPAVVNDDREAGRQAALALLDAGYDRLLVLASGKQWHMRLRCKGVEEAAHTRQVPVSMIDLEFRRPEAGETFQDIWLETQRMFLEALRALPANSGIVAMHHGNALEGLTMLREDLGREVPGDVGMVLADLPQLADASLAHVRLAGEEIGRRCVDLLLARLRNANAELPVLTEISPVGIAPGASLRGDEVTALHQQLHDWCVRHLREQVTVEEMARQLGHSRRSLEMKLHERGLVSPYHFLTQLRLRETRGLLETTSMRMDDVAEACGFNSARAMANRFRAEHGVSPANWRKQERLR